MLKTAYKIRGLSSAYIHGVFVKTEMILKSKSVLSGSNKLNRSCSSENLPTSQSQMNIQMASHTLTIREVIIFLNVYLAVKLKYYSLLLPNLFYFNVLKCY